MSESRWRRVGCFWRERLGQGKDKHALPEAARDLRSGNSGHPCSPRQSARGFACYALLSTACLSISHGI